jgi:hypothetical protein
MEEKRTHASVTQEPCTCGYLHNRAVEPENPIEFDEATNEFQLKYFDNQDNCPAMLVIYHCPFCGGAAPKSKRNLLFATISRSESLRLAEIVSPIKTIIDAVNTLGAPDLDGHSTSSSTGGDSTPPSIEYHREIRFHRLSEVANVVITERQDGTVWWRLDGKSLNVPRDDA